MNIKNIISSFFEWILGWHKKEKASWHDGRPHKYVFDLRGKEVEISADIPIRNYRTFLRDKDDVLVCECGEKLVDQCVGFSLNGSGRVLHRPVKYCPKCDQMPADYSSLTATIDGQLVFV